MPFFSPEIAKGIQYSKEVDVWAFGCFAYELATGSTPFSAIYDEAKLLKSIISKPHEPISEKWSRSFNDFIDKCLAKDPEERWSMEKLLNHDFLVGLNEKETFIACGTKWI